MRSRMIYGVISASIMALSSFSLSAQSGIASWFGEECRGKLAADGSRCNPDALTCAAWGWPLGTTLQVTCGEHSVIVVVRDRGPARHLHRLIDLSRAAFSRIAELDRGLAQVRVVPVAGSQLERPPVPHGIGRT